MAENDEESPPASNVQTVEKTGDEPSQKSQEGKFASIDQKDLFAFPSISKVTVLFIVSLIVFCIGVGTWLYVTFFIT